ncbi:MAG: hypothetical protein HC803_02755, partial [Saprospiraceae bacterium]|nr:hypothetical protein [Saprospiraceae bacterium]
MVLDVDNSHVLEAPNAPSIVNVNKTNVTDCGVTDGTIDIMATGGTAPLEYSINGGSSWQVNGGAYTGLAAGTYQIRVRNAGGTCIVTYPNVTITAPSQPTIVSINNANPSNCGLANGTINIMATGANNSLLEYSIDNGTTWQPSNLFVNLAGGSYPVKVRNADGTCMVSGTTIILNDAVPPTLNSVVTTNETNCSAGDGSITITASGAQAIEYSINNGGTWATSGSFTGLSAGSYIVRIRNINGTCEVNYPNNPVIITAPSAGSITNVASANPTNCSLANGSIIISATGSTTLQYSINGGTTWQTSNSFTGLSGGTYQIRISNASDTSCMVTAPNVTLIDKVAPVISNVASANPSNCGVTDGSITISATSGQGSVEYSIDGGVTYQPSNVFSGLTAGTYQIRVRNIDGTCVVSAANVTLVAPQLPVINSVASANPLNCGSTNGTITVNATGTSIEYSINSGASWQTSNSFTGLGSGTYNISVRNTDGTCAVLYASNPVILTAPSAPSITNVASANPSNCGVTDGTITITATGGVAPLEYSINGGTSWQASNSFTGLAGGTYQIVVRNSANGGTCPVQGQIVTLTNKVAPSIGTVASTNVTNCGLTNGTITITATGNGSLEYSINGGTTYQPSNVFSGLAAGTYQIRVRNIDGTCVVSNADVTITTPTAPVIASAIGNNPTDCNSNNGTITVSATGAAGLQYSIDGGVNWVSNGGAFTGLTAGTYNVSVRNLNGGTCVTPYTSNPIVLTAPNAGTITNVASTNVTNCGLTDGTITITATGSNLEYSIGGVYQASNVFNNLAAGTYNISIRNVGGSCIVTGQIVTITAPTAPTIDDVIAANPTNCGVNDGTITIDATPGSGTLQYSINGGTTWSQSGSFTGLTAGTYQIRVRNLGGTCLVSDADVTLVAPVLPAITNVAPTSPSDCGVTDGSIVITATGVSIQYSIDGGLNFQASNTFSGLTSGTYNVVVRNTDGTCSVAYASNPVILTAPNAPSITNVSSTSPTNCGLVNGTITISATGGTAPLQYSINNGATWAANGGSFTGLAGGTYNIKVRNAGGTCEVAGQVVTLTDKVAPVIGSVASTNITNCGFTDGTITITANGGGTLQYSINGGTTWQQSGTYTGLAAGTYQIRVRNIDGTCIVSSANVIITAPTAPVITNVSKNNPSNCGINDGTITVTATAGTGATEYSIDGGLTWQNSGSFTGLSAGTYNVRIRNLNGTCTVAYATNPVTLIAPSAPSIVNVASTNPTNCGLTNGTITISASGGTAPLQYSINGGSTWQASNTFSGLAGGTYQIRVSNAGATNPCTVTYPNVTLVAPVAPVIATVVSTDQSDCNVVDGTITITASGSGALQYSINGGSTWQASDNFTGLAAGTYQIRVRNINGTCIVSAPNEIINVPETPVINKRCSR